MIGESRPRELNPNADLVNQAVLINGEFSVRRFDSHGDLIPPINLVEQARSGAFGTAPRRTNQPVTVGGQTHYSDNTVISGPQQGIWPPSPQKPR